MNFHGYPCIATSAEVWAVIHARHAKEMDVHSSFSDSTNGRMETTYAIKGSDRPLIGARTTWEAESDFRRKTEQHEYWIFLNLENKDE